MSSGNNPFNRSPPPVDPDAIPLPSASPVLLRSNDLETPPAISYNPHMASPSSVFPPDMRLPIQSRPTSSLVSGESESSFSDASSSETSLSNSGAERSSDHLRMRRMRRTWRQSIKEQEDEESVTGLSNEECKAKCKKLQAKVRVLQDQLLQANTEVTRLENANINAKQVSTKAENSLVAAEQEKLQLQKEFEEIKNVNEKLHKSNEKLTMDNLRLENDALSKEQEYRKTLRDIERGQRGNSSEYEYLPDQEQLMSTIAVLKTELNLLREDKSQLQQKLEGTEKIVEDLETALESHVNEVNHALGSEISWVKEIDSVEKASLISNLAEEYVNKLKELKNEVESSNGSNPELFRANQLQGQIYRTHALIDSCFNTASALRTKVSDIFCSVVHIPFGTEYAIEKKMESLQNMMEDISCKAGDMRRELDECQAIKGQFQFQLEEHVRKATTDLKEEVTTMAAKLLSAENECQERNSMVKELSKTILSMQENIESLEGKVSQNTGGVEASEFSTSDTNEAKEAETKYLEAFERFYTEMGEGRETVVTKENLMIKTSQKEIDIVTRDSEPTDEELDDIDKAHVDINNCNQKIKAKETICLELMQGMKELFLKVNSKVNTPAYTATTKTFSPPEAGVQGNLEENMVGWLKLLHSMKTLSTDGDETQSDDRVSSAVDIGSKVVLVGETLDDILSRFKRMRGELKESKALFQTLMNCYISMASSNSGLESISESDSFSTLVHCCKNVMRKYGSLFEANQLKTDEIRKYQKQIQELKEELESKLALPSAVQESGDISFRREENESLEKELDKLRMTNLELNNSLVTKDEEIKKLHDQLQSSEALHSKVILDYERSIGLAKDEAHHEVQHSSSLETELQDLKRKHSQEMVDMQQKHLEENAGLTHKLEIYKTQISEFHITVSQLKSEKGSLRDEMRGLLGRLEEKVKAESLTAVKHEEQIVELTNALSELGSENEIIKMERSTREGDFEKKEVKASEAVEQYDSQISELKLLISEFETKEISLKNEIRGLQDKIEAVEANKSTIVQKSELQILELHKSLNDLEGIVKTLTSERDALNLELRKAKETLEGKSSTESGLVERYVSQISEMQEAIFSLQSEKASLESQFSTLQQRVERDSHATQKSDLEISALNTSVTTLKAEKEELKAEILSIQEKLDAGTSSNAQTVADFEAKVAELQNSLSTLEEERDVLVANQNTVRMALDEKTASESKKVEEYVCQISDLNKSITTLESEKDALKLEMTNLRTSFEAQNSELQISLKNAEAEKLLLTTQVEKLESAVAVSESKAEACQCSQLENELSVKKEEVYAKVREVTAYQEQVKQHSLTIVAIEERLNVLVTKNKEYREEIEKLKNEIEEKSITIEEFSSKEISREHVESNVHSRPRVIVQQGPGAPQNNQQSLVRLRRENANLKNQNTQAQKVIEALRRDMSGLAARLTDVAGEVEESTKKQYDDNRTRLVDADRELTAHKVKVKDLFKIVDEKVAEIKRLTSEQKKLKEIAIKLKKSVTEKEKLLKELEDRLDKCKGERQTDKEKFDTEMLATKDLVNLGSVCRGERHEQVIVNQRDALNELRAQIRAYELYPRPGPSHDEALQQVMLLKKELSEMRAKQALKETVGFTVSTEKESITEEATVVQDDFEATTQRINVQTVDLSESSYLNLLRSVGVALELEEVSGDRRLSHMPVDEQLRIFREREQACTIVGNRIRLIRERLARKEELLMGYEEDLAKLRRAEELVKVREIQIDELGKEVRQRTEESQCLRHTLERSRERVEPSRTYVTKVVDKKFPALHNCYNRVSTDTLTQKVAAAKTKEKNELIKKKDYEIKVLKSELGRRGQQLDLCKKQLTVAQDKETKKAFETPSPPGFRPSSAKTRRTRVTTTRRPVSAKLPSRSDPPFSPTTSSPLDGLTAAAATSDVLNSLETSVWNTTDESKIVEENGMGLLGSETRREFPKPPETMFDEMLAESEDTESHSFVTQSSSQLSIGSGTKVHFATTKMKEDSSDF